LQAIGLNLESRIRNPGSEIPMVMAYSL